MSGLRLKSSFATLGNIAVQPKATTSFAATSITPGTILKKSVLADNLFSTVAASRLTKVGFAKFDFHLFRDFINIKVDTRYSDELPQSAAKFSPFEELSGIASTRPEILSVSEFKPIFTSNRYGLTAAGEFLDAQVKLMNLRHQAVVTLVNDLKKDPDLAEQLDQIEGDFLAHVKNLKARGDFLITIQKHMERVTKLLDLRAAGSNVDAAGVVAAYFSSIFSNVNTAQAALPPYTYANLLSQHGFTKNNVVTFSNTKIFLQTLYEARKILRAGTDELVGTDLSLASRDADPAKLNKRTYRDPHVELGRISIPTFTDFTNRGIHQSDSKLNSLLYDMETNFRSLDRVFTSATSEEVSYTLKIRTLAREMAYSHALSNSSVVSLLNDYGYPVSSELGNQQLFDAVYGQLGSQITDNRTGTNPNSVASIASRVDGDKAVLTYEVDYLEDSQGSVFTPGSAYYVAGVLRPNADSAFSLEHPTELVQRFTTVIDRYIDFIGRFNLLPKTGNTEYNKLANVTFTLDPVVMTNSLYTLFVDAGNNRLRDDSVRNPIVDFLAEAATNASIRANLLLYFTCVTNAAGDGLQDAAAARALAGQDLRQESLNRAADAENQNARVGPTVDKLIANCVRYYKSITGDSSGATKVENALKNFNEQGPLARVIAYVKASHDAYKTVLNNGYSRYSHISDVSMVSLAMQIVLDTARRYAYERVRVNKGTYLNTNFYKAASNIDRVSNSVQSVTQALATRSLGKSSLASRAVVAPVKYASLSIAFLASKLSIKQAVLARLEREESLVIQTVLAPLHAMRAVRDNLKAFILFLQRQDSVKTLNDILAVVGDRKLVELLNDKGQIRLLHDTLDTVLQKIDLGADNAKQTDLTDVVSLTRTGKPEDDLKIFDDSFITSKTLNVMKSVFADAKYGPARGNNIRVIAVGFPHGFSTHLQTKFKIGTFAEQVRARVKQNDVVVVDVYKIDARYPDLVFKPIPKVFELSRFPVRDERKYGAVKQHSALDAIPTVDFSDMENPQTTSATALLRPEDYQFMTKADYTQMLRNTTMSYMLELYTRTLTGIPISERELYMQDPDETDRPAPFVVKAILQNTAEKTFNIPTPSNLKLNFSAVSVTKGISYFAATQANKSKRPFAALSKSKLIVLANPSHKYLGKAHAHADAGAHLAKKKTVYTDRDLAAKYMMTPKLFERVFFVDVDPDDYEIDKEETFKSEVGRATFAQLYQAGEIEVRTENLNGVQRETYFLKDLRLEKQMTFEKYFVTVRDYTPLTTRTR